MSRPFLVLGAFCGLFLVLVLGAYIVVRNETAPVSRAEISGTYEVTDSGGRATLTLHPDHTYTHSIRLKDGETHDSDGTYTVGRGSVVFIEFSNFELIPSFGFGARTDHWATEVWRNWLGHVQFCYDSDVGYCYVKKD